MMMTTTTKTLKGASKMRGLSLLLGLCNFFILLIGAYLIFQIHSLCRPRFLPPFAIVSIAALLRLLLMLRTALAQQVAAQFILNSPSDASTDSLLRLHRREKYKKWLWWSRCTSVFTVIQFVCAGYLLIKSPAYLSTDSACPLAMEWKSQLWKQRLLSFFMIMVSFVAVLQCFAGSDVLRWRSFYESQDDAWKCHYREVFDNGIRETLCCLGRVKYLSALEEDEVYSVARLLGDLVAYRATGTGHMELLAGLTLLQSQENSSESYEDAIEPPEAKMREAAALHKFAEAAYTGPLLDLGRNPFLFPCAWLYRQGILSPWSRNSRPVLEGDNWWRGHAAAFLKYVNLPPEVLRQGRVSQFKCQAAYFIVVLHHLRTVVITIRGTETPEDLITDGLCKECTLSTKDLAGLTNCSHIPSNIKKIVTSSFPHHAHSGIVEAARELFMQIEGNADIHSTESYGLLSQLLGVGCECYGYNIRIVGHSLGGAIAALLGLQLYSRYPNLHVYSFGPLPCVDFVVANACSEFITSIIYGNEFSSRLSIGSVMRLRAAAITSLSQDPKADSAMIFRLAHRFLNVSNYQRNKSEAEDQPDYYSGSNVQENLKHQICKSQFETDERGSKKQDAEKPKRECAVAAEHCQYANPFDSEEGNECGEYTLWADTKGKDHIVEIDNAELTNPFATDASSVDDPVTQFIDTVPSSKSHSDSDPPEMYLPGLVIHIIPVQNKPQTSIKPWRIGGSGRSYKAYLANRENFKDIIVSPSMFLDHLPWRCHDALKKLMKSVDD
ncbi:uncharacterized protein LOC107467700 isoform X1 [Arachis duranensis]|uniref:Uncharacterized protein LOC107467700 isoform X1 n=2 Tax=Arachis duranensis TaxID=130453 RepID=A0A6P4C7N7_ARADU|nr:uncharacterized protein LOC107467700 isoform X1 [Arachis duranensis]